MKSSSLLKNPVKHISDSMDTYSGTYSITIRKNRIIILTQNPDFINYVLKENHRNYNKSEPGRGRAINYFGNGLLFSDGEYWLKQRRLIQPAFHKENLQGLYSLIEQSINESLIDFPIGKNIDIYPIINSISFKILLKSLFDLNISHSEIEEIIEIFMGMQDFLLKDVNQPLRKIFYPITGSLNKQRASVKRLRNILKKIVSERKFSDNESKDILNLLINSRYEDTGESMSIEQIVDEIITLFFAGHETTANTISWLLYLLSVNKNVEEKLSESLANNTIFESIKNEYLIATLHEAMRLYPAVWWTKRVAIEDDIFDEISYPKNTMIIPFFFGLHTDKAYWHDNFKFIPDRFIRDKNITRSKNYFPFGSGPRMCIGNNFAIAEMSFFLFSFLKNFSITSSGQNPKMKPLITFRPDKIILNIERINV
ncbi:cytochrome P450 [Dyadobacter frigoris]|nr:cytochrome P450 [Dyadobacter frigoris]